jgi:phosphoserine phosphatase
MRRASVNAIRAVTFDLDGTLIVGTSADAHLGRALGFMEDILEWDRQYVAGAISVKEFAEKDAAHYLGRKKTDMFPILASAPVISGIRETVDRLHAERMLVLLGTVAWAFTAEHFRKEYGFDASSGTVAGEDASGVFNGVIEKHFDEYDKVEWVEDLCRKKNISMNEVAAVGDSRSDIPLFEKVGLAIALNATAKAREAADISLGADDLSVVLEPILSAGV